MYKPAAAWSESNVAAGVVGENRFPKKGRFSMKFSLVPLLITGQSISPEVRQALRENRLQDAAKLIMQEYGLSCGADG